MPETKKPRARKPKQKELPGMETPRNAKIEGLAERFVEARQEWQARHQPMEDAKALLHTAMKEAKLTVYEFDGQRVEIMKDEKVRVKRMKGAEDE